MAEKTEFLQAIDDAILDADSLEQFINGSDSETVLTRLSAQYPTLQRAIKDMFENGGIPATPFKTKAEMEVSSLEDGDYAVVTDDGVDNGLYVKESGVWFKSEYDIYSEFEDTKAKSNKLQRLIANKPLEHLLLLLDDNDQPVVSIDGEGEVWLQGVDKSVQHLLTKLISHEFGSVSLSSVDGNALVAIDKDDNVLFRVDSSGGFFVNGLESSVQKLLFKNEESLLDPPKVSSTNVGYSKNIRDSYKDNEVFRSLILNASNEYLRVSPAPRHMTENNMSVGSGWVDDPKISTDIVADGVEVTGIDYKLREDIGVVHPQVWEFDGKLAGYRYWLAITPYTANYEDYELPFIYGTNDPELRDWVMIDGFPAPFEADPKFVGESNRGHLSDAGMCYDPKTGDLILLWRKSLYYPSSPAKYAVMGCRYDGFGWSDIYEILPLQTADNITAPNIIFNPNDKLFYMYSTYGKRLRYRTSQHLNGGGWSSPAYCTLDKNDNIHWHVDIKCLGNKVVALLHADGTMSNPNGKDAFFWAVSSDYTNFTVSSESFITTEIPHIYKGTFLPVYTDNNFSDVNFKVIYTTDGSTADREQAKAWELRVSSTNNFNLEK